MHRDGPPPPQQLEETRGVGNPAHHFGLRRDASGCRLPRLDVLLVHNLPQEGEVGIREACGKGVGGGGGPKGGGMQDMQA